MAKSHATTERWLKKPMSDCGRRRLGKRLTRQREKITTIIKSLQLNRHHIEEIIEEHKQTYEKLKGLERKFPAQPKQKKQIRSIEKEVGMPTQEIGRRVAIIVGKKAEVRWRRMILFRPIFAWSRQLQKTGPILFLVATLASHLSASAQRIANLTKEEGYAS